MERMDMHSRNEYLEVLRGRYLKAKTKKEKSQILDEFCCNTGQARKYVIRKIQPGVDLRPKQRIGGRVNEEVRYAPEPVPEVDGIKPGL